MALRYCNPEWNLYTEPNLISDSVSCPYFTICKFVQLFSLSSYIAACFAKGIYTYIGNAKQQNKDVLTCRTLTVGGWWWYTIRRHCGGALAKRNCILRSPDRLLLRKLQDISVDGPYKVVLFVCLWGSRLPTVLATAVLVLCVFMLHNKLSRMRRGMKKNTTALLEQFNYNK